MLKVGSAPIKTNGEKERHSEPQPGGEQRNRPTGGNIEMGYTVCLRHSVYHSTTGKRLSAPWCVRVLPYQGYPLIWHMICHMVCFGDGRVHVLFFVLLHVDRGEKSVILAC